VNWFNARIKLDVEAVALRLAPRCATRLTDLHLDLCDWMLERDQVPPVAAEFRQLLEELCCEIRIGDGDERVENVRHNRHHSKMRPPATDWSILSSLASLHVKKRP
jgi:hypothetical protein